MSVKDKDNVLKGYIDPALPKITPHLYHPSTTITICRSGLYPRSRYSGQYGNWQRNQLCARAPRSRPGRTFPRVYVTSERCSLLHTEFAMPLVVWMNPEELMLHEV